MTLTARRWRRDVYKRQPVLVAAVSSLFGVRALFTGILSSRTRGTVPEMLLVSATMIVLLCVIEYIYMRVVKHSSDRDVYKRQKLFCGTFLADVGSVFHCHP